MTPPSAPKQPQPAPGSAWARWRNAHLHDYPPAATRLWLLITGLGLAAGIWALTGLVAQPPDTLWQVGAGLLLVALAALFPVQIPRTTHTVLVADVFIFTILALLGAPAAVLAAGTEGLIGALRSSKRLSSRFSAPTAAMAAMAACAAAYAGLHHGLRLAGLPDDMAVLVALCAAAPLQVALTTGSLMRMMAAKKGKTLHLRDWYGAASWVAAMTLGAAFVAGLVQLNARRSGPVVLLVAAALAFALVSLLRLSLRRLETERQGQEAKVSEAQREAELSQQRFTAAFTHAAIGMAIVQPAGTVLQVNQALSDLLGRPEAALLGQPFSDLLHVGDAAQFQRRAHESGLAGGGPGLPFSMQLRCMAVDGGELWVALHCSRFDDPGGGGQHLIFQLHDITSRHLAESRLQHIAYHDSLTDLANRACFHERLQAAVDGARADAGHRYAVMFLDLDRFKIVNDSLGHVAGNELLREVAQRLVACVRPSDLVARLGGDEFAVLLEDLQDAEADMALAERVLQVLSQPMSINGTEVIPGASVGITFSDLGPRSVDEVLRDADLAMYRAKAEGRGRVALFDHSMLEQVAEKLALEADLRHAIGEGALSVVYQPLFHLNPYRPYGFEALARWVDPVRGPVSPTVFIALAEESGHIEVLTDWVLDQSLAQLSLWQRQMPAAATLGMHVNISGRDLARSDLVEIVERLLQRHDVAANCLTLEITETMLMQRLDVALQTMARLRERGVLFSIDDFGTGYSSLAYLSTLPIDSIKIDRSFVMGMDSGAQNVEIVRAVLNLGLSLGRKVIAEGIETPEQLATLRAMGVPIGQGYLLSRPLKAEQVAGLLALSLAATPGATAPAAATSAKATTAATAATAAMAAMAVAAAAPLVADTAATADAA